MGIMFLNNYLKHQFHWFPGTSDFLLKELEHRKLGWKVFILKYDVGKSLSKEMWCKMADTTEKFNYIF